MAIKKSEIYGQIWAACDKLRGGVEPARYKDYILTLLFVKYVSDRYKSSDNWDIEVPEGGSFDDIVKLKYKKNIGEGINIVIGKLAEQNELKGIIDIADFNSEELGSDKEAVDKLSGLVEIFQKPELDFTNNRAGGDDILGDAYEFLMRKFAQDSGKSKGQFYTPGEVSRIMAKVIGISRATDSSMTVYDKTTPRLLQSHTLENAVKPPFLGGFFISSVSAAETGELSERKMLRFPTELCND